MDKRIKLTTEVLGGIRILKYYAWEDPFRSKIEGIRAAELLECESDDRSHILLFLALLLVYGSLLLLF